MGKTVIAPIIAVIVIGLQLVGINIPQDVSDQVVLALTNLVAVGTVVYGIIKNHKK